MKWGFTLEAAIDPRRVLGCRITNFKAEPLPLQIDKRRGTSIPVSILEGFEANDAQTEEWTPRLAPPSQPYTPSALRPRSG